ncbi:MAG TPA: hypothetical protein IAA60_07785 [Candidatus Ornithomonoglobus intestinigallinarum]|uniref:Uncharacterized protein n=1 Tax=Candidatus Ornithomonoglobus intestinigallinarum TaxID=2840894 RepID=A0A9D1KRM9_9FIRM|nr:hypothetical protein [Candidatus Ornithomonoglobus intestinigallinarum]
MRTKILTLICSLCLMVSGIGFGANAAEPLPEAQTELEILKSLGIVNGYEDKETENNSVMSKCTFVNFLLNITDGGRYGSTYDPEAIEQAKQRGILAQSSVVSADQPLIYEEAMKMAVVLLGYGEISENNGGYPGGYLSRASELRLTEGVSPSGEIKNYEAYRILLNVTEAPIMLKTFPNGDYQIDNGTNLLEYYRDIYKIEGVVTANRVSGLYDTAAAGPDSVKIESDTYLDPDGLLSSCLGYRIKGYARKGELDTYTVISGGIDERVTVTEIDTSSITDISDDCRTFEYCPDKSSSKTVKAEAAASASLLYNGVVSLDYNAEDFNDDGTVLFIDNDSDGKADVIKLNVYKTMIVSSVSSGTRTINNEFSYEGALAKLNVGDIEANNYEVRFYKDGALVDFGAVAAGDVLSVYSPHEGYEGDVEVYISSQKTTGSVDSVSMSDETVTVGGTEYELASSFIKANSFDEAFAADISAGDRYDVYIDVYGKVAGMKSVQSSMQYAYMQKIYKDEEEIVYTKLFNVDGEWNTYAFADKVAVNGSSRRPLEAFDELSTGVDGIVGYVVNGEGKINRLELPMQYTDDISNARLNTIGEQTGTFRYNNTTFDSNYYMTADTKVIFVPEDEEMRDNENNYSIGNNYSFRSNVSITYTGYCRDEFYCLGIVLVRQSLSDMTAVDNESYFVRDVKTVYDDGDVTNEIVVSNNTYLGLSVKTSDSSIGSDIKKGDIIKIHVDPSGRINTIEKLFDYDSGAVPDMSANLYDWSYVRGTALKTDISGSRLLLNSTREIALRVPDVPVLVYDTFESDVRGGSLGDIEPGDFIVADVHQNKVMTLYVYKNME